jgi:hypothetical protein
MTSLSKAVEIADRLTAAGIDATCDPRGANPPCVLLTPPNGLVDHLCGATGTWALFALSPTTANIDAWQALDEMLAAIESVLSIEGWDFVAYSLSPDNPPLPAYRIRYTEAFEL